MSHQHTTVRGTSSVGNLRLLPLELREEIYGHVFPKHFVIPCTHRSEKAQNDTKRPYGNENTRSSLTILRTCKQVAQEASLILHLTCEFTINTCLHDKQVPLLERYNFLADNNLIKFSFINSLTIVHEPLSASHIGTIPFWYLIDYRIFAKSFAIALWILRQNTPKNLLHLQIPLKGLYHGIETLHDSIETNKGLTLETDSNVVLFKPLREWNTVSVDFIHENDILCNEAAKYVGSRLERVLGPSSLVPGPNDGERHVRSLVFEPRRHRSPLSEDEDSPPIAEQWKGCSADSGAGVKEAEQGEVWAKEAGVEEAGITGHGDSNEAMISRLRNNLSRWTNSNPGNVMKTSQLTHFMQRQGCRSQGTRFMRQLHVSSLGIKSNQESMVGASERS